LIFRDLRKIGEGSSGVVFYGVIRSTCEKVAIKVIYYKTKSESESAALRNEILLQKSSKHPNIIQYKGSFTRDGQLWVVLEYMDGGTVANLLDASKISEPQIAAICREILKAVVMLHDNNKVHRGIFYYLQVTNSG
jgi:serine/threonine protein kinase